MEESANGPCTARWSRRPAERVPRARRGRTRPQRTGWQCHQPLTNAHSDRELNEQAEQQPRTNTLSVVVWSDPAAWASLPAAEWASSACPAAASCTAAEAAENTRDTHSTAQRTAISAAASLPRRHAPCPCVLYLLLLLRSILLLLLGRILETKNEKNHTVSTCKLAPPRAWPLCTRGPRCPRAVCVCVRVTCCPCCGCCCHCCCCMGCCCC